MSLKKPNEYTYEELFDLVNHNDKFKIEFPGKTFYDLENTILPDAEYERVGNEANLNLFQLQLFGNAFRQIILKRKRADSPNAYYFAYEKSGKNKFKLKQSQYPPVFYDLKVNKKFKPKLPWDNRLFVKLIKEQYPTEVDLPDDQIIIKYSDKLKDQQKINKTTYETVLEHSFWEWHTNVFSDYFTNKFLSDESNIVARLSSPLNSSIPAIIVKIETNSGAYFESKLIEEAKKLLSIHILRTPPDKFDALEVFKAEDRGLKIVLYISFSYFKVFQLWKPFDLFQENYDLLKIAVNKFGITKLTLKVPTEKKDASTFDYLEKTAILLDEKLKALSDKKENEDYEHFYQEPEILNKDQEYYSLPTSLERIKEKYELQLSLIGDAILKFKDYYPDKYKFICKDNPFCLDYNQELHNEEITFYFDELFNLIAIGSNTNKIPASDKKAPKELKDDNTHIPFSVLNKQWNPTIGNGIEQINALEKHRKLLFDNKLDLGKDNILLITENFAIKFFKEFENLSFAVVKVLPSDFNSTELKKKSRYFIDNKFSLPFIYHSSFDEIKSEVSGNDKWEYPFLRHKTVNGFLLCHERFLPVCKPGGDGAGNFLTWTTLTRDYHYPKLIYKAPSTKPKVPEPKDGNEPDKNTKDRDEAIEKFKILAPIFSGKYNCLQELEKINSGHDFLEFFFFKFPWYELAARSMHRLREIGAQYGPIDRESIACIDDLNITRLYCTYLSAKDFWLHWQDYVLMGIHSIPTFPLFPYINIVDFLKQLRYEIINYLVEIAFHYLEGLVGFLLRDLFANCNIEGAFCYGTFKKNDKLAENIIDITLSEQHTYKNNQSFQGLGEPMYFAESTNVSKMFLKNPLFIYDLLETKYGISPLNGHKELRDFFEMLTVSITDIELYALLWGNNPPNKLMKLIYLIASKISVELGEILRIEKRILDFFSDLSKFVNKDFIIQKINANNFYFKSEPCAPPNIIDDDSYRKAIIEDLKKKGKSDGEIEEYILHSRTRTMTEIETLCGFISTKLHEAISTLPATISGPSAEGFHRYFNIYRDAAMKLQEHTIKEYHIWVFINVDEKTAKEDLKLIGNLPFIFDILDNKDTKEQKEIKAKVGEFDTFIGKFTPDNYCYILENKLFIKTEISSATFSGIKIPTSTSNEKIFYKNINKIISTSYFAIDEEIATSVKEEIYSPLKSSTIVSIADKSKIENTDLRKKFFSLEGITFDKENNPVANEKDKKWISYKDELTKDLSNARVSEGNLKNIEMMIHQIHELEEK